MTLLTALLGRTGSVALSVPWPGSTSGLQPTVDREFTGKLTAPSLTQCITQVLSFASVHGAVAAVACVVVVRVEESTCQGPPSGTAKVSAFSSQRLEAPENPLWRPQETASYCPDTSAFNLDTDVQST